MLSIALLAAAIAASPCTDPLLTGDTLLPLDGAAAVSALAAGDHGKLTDAQNGMLYVTAVFAKTSAKPRRDADSALACLRRAITVCPDNPVLKAYGYTARLVRAQHGEIAETRFVLDTLRLYFDALDTLAKQHPENYAVQFIAGCVLQNAFVLKPAVERYWWRSKRILDALYQKSLANNCPSFFTPEIRANIRLNLAYLEGKLGGEDGKDLRRAALAQVITDFPSTRAAEQARTSLEDPSE